MVLFEENHVLFSLTVILAANVSALTYARVVRFEQTNYSKADRIIERIILDQGESEQNKSDIRGNPYQYLGADPENEKNKTDQLQNIELKIKSDNMVRFGFSTTLLVDF